MGAKYLTLSTLLFQLIMCSAMVINNILDMTYEFGEDTLYWPIGESFEQTFLYRGPGSRPEILWYESSTFSAPDHGGTHLDAPSHFSEGKLRVIDIPLERFVARPAVRIDISTQAANSKEYQLTVNDLQVWEARNGLIPDGALLFVYTGWGAFYPDRLAYFGSARNDTYLDDQGKSLLHFPGVSSAAATWLVANRNITGLGMDTPSIDYGQSVIFETHQILFGGNIYALENVANLDKLPTTGAKVFAVPMKIDGASGAPMRIFAVLDDNATCAAGAHQGTLKHVLITSILIIYGLMF